MFSIFIYLLIFILFIETCITVSRFIFIYLYNIFSLQIDKKRRLYLVFCFRQNFVIIKFIEHLLDFYLFIVIN